MIAVMVRQHDERAEIPDRRLIDAEGRVETVGPGLEGENRTGSMKQRVLPLMTTTPAWPIRPTRTRKL